VFAGDEIGAEGCWGEDARTPFPWHDREAWDIATLESYRALLTIRRSSSALAEGGLRWLHAGTDTIAFVREHPEESVLIVVARQQAAPVRLSLAELGGSGVRLMHGFGAEEVAEQVVINIPSAGAGVWRVEGV